MSKEKVQEGESWFEVFKTVFWALVIAFIFRTFLFQPFHIPSGSMKPNLLIGDFIVVSQFSYGYSNHSFPFVSIPLFDGRIWYDEPKRGDIVVFKVPERGYGNDVFVKRLVGLPGDEIEVRNSVLHINGEPVSYEETGEFFIDEQSGISLDIYQETLPEGKSYPVLDEEYRIGSDETNVFKVPEGYFFMMGDNRDNSSDSRFDAIGMIPQDRLIGRAEIILFSSEGALVNPAAWRGDRFFINLRD